MTSRISISLSPCPGHLVRQSSSLLQSYLSRMFGIECVEDEKNRSMIVVGRIGDAHVQTASGGLPRMTSQGHLLRRTNPDTLLLAGGSDAATAWAVYELLERYGVRFLLSGDVLPTNPGSLHLPDLDLVFEPAQKHRAWRIRNELPYGSLMWTLDEHKHQKSCRIACAAL